MLRQRVGSRMSSGLYGETVELLGQQIVDGTIPPDSKLLAEQICNELGISRPVVREAVRTLAAMGLVESRPQIGTKVLPPSEWDLLNPYVVRWRARGPEYRQQMYELLELRLGIEPNAATLAAQRISPESAAELVDLGERMRKMMLEGRPREYFDLDAEFHAHILKASGNAVIAQLADIIAETLNARGLDTRPDMLNMTEQSIGYHLQLAAAIAAGDASAARKQAEYLVEHTLSEFAEATQTH